MDIAMRWSAWKRDLKRGGVSHRDAMLAASPFGGQGMKLTRAQQQRCRSRALLVEARLFEPAIFDPSKLKVQFLGEEHGKHPAKHPRTYTLTHSDLTAHLTLAISREINKAQIMGWYNRLQRDEVLAEWKKVRGEMSLHVHCHISGGHWLLDAIAPLRFYIFRKELPVVIEAFRHGDSPLFENHPELETALVWVYFHSNLKEFNRVECWGQLVSAGKSSEPAKRVTGTHQAMEELKACSEQCDCCSQHSLIPADSPLEALSD